MTMSTLQGTAAVARKLDGVLLIFQRYEGVWMIDRVSAPANERGDEELVEVPDSLLESDDSWEAMGFDGGTAVARDELWGLSESQRRRYHERQLRKLGLPERGHGARLLWSMISDFEGFHP